jgi:hypothetical protein
LQPALTWIDLTARDRDQMRRVLDLFSEQGTVDEMGLGVIRDAFADALFPGTSSIQTRLRYVLFIPWIYKRFEERRRPSTDIAREAREAEIALVHPLKESSDAEGIIGVRAGKELSRLPSHVYWAGLVRWGVFPRPQSQSWYHTHFESLRKGAKDVGRADDPGVIWERKPVWHPRLPPPPDDFPAVVSFALTPTESDFIRGRFEEESFWDDPVIGGAPENVRSVVELARRFSLHVEGLPLLYNLLLTQLRLERHGESEDEARVARYRAEIAEWAARETAEALFSPQELWAFMACSRSKLTNPLRQFLESWSARLAEIGPANIAEDTELARLIRLREHRLKGARARFTNEGRLLDFTRGVGLGRMDFRWFRVRQLLIDLHRGFAA